MGRKSTQILNELWINISGHKEENSLCNIQKEGNFLILKKEFRHRANSVKAGLNYKQK
jgi:hypothetical protein